MISADQAAEILGVGVNWIYEQASADRLPSYLIGRSRKFRVSELEAFIQDHARGKRPTPRPGLL